MESTAFNQAGWNPLHLIGMHFTTLHGIYCIQSRCMEFTAFNQDPLGHDAWSPLRSIKIHCTTLHGIHCILSRSIGPRCMESTPASHPLRGTLSRRDTHTCPHSAPCAHTLPSPRPGQTNPSSRSSPRRLL